MPQQVHRGLAKIESFIAAFLSEAKPVETLIVRGRDSYVRSGAGQMVTALAGAEALEFSDFSTNPKHEDLQRGIGLLKDREIKRFIAVGGGSVLDMAKLLNHALKGRRCPLLAIPTTSGSGSEATHFAVCYHGLDKVSVADPVMTPGFVILVPEWTYSMSTYQTACSGMDALAQGIESYWARGATEESRGYALDAVGLAMRYLDDAVNRPAPVNRAGMQEAAYLSGKAINISKTTGAHAMSYVLTAKFGLAHGAALALLLPAFVEHHQRKGIEVPHVTGQTIRTLIDRIGLSTKINVADRSLALLFREHVNVERLKNNPVVITDEFLDSVSNSLSCPAQTLKR